jgi:hypothetical protein
MEYMSLLVFFVGLELRADGLVGLHYSGIFFLLYARILLPLLCVYFSCVSFLLLFWMVLGVSILRLSGDWVVWVGIWFGFVCSRLVGFVGCNWAVDTRVVNGCSVL